MPPGFVVAHRSSLPMVNRSCRCVTLYYINAGARAAGPQPEVRAHARRAVRHSSSFNDAVPQRPRYRPGREAETDRRRSRRAGAARRRSWAVRPLQGESRPFGVGAAARQEAR